MKRTKIDRAVFDWMSKADAAVAHVAPDTKSSAINRSIEDVASEVRKHCSRVASGAVVIVVRYDKKSAPPFVMPPT